MSAGSRLVILRVVTTIVTMGWPICAAAQDPPSPAATPRAFGQLRLGSLSFTPTFKITNLGWDTNVFDVSGVERRPADFTGTLDPGFDTRLTTNRLDIRARTDTAFVYYRTYKSEQAFNPHIDLQIDDRLSSRLALYARGAYGYSKERTGFEIDSRPRVFSRSTTAGVRIGGRRLRLDVHGVYGNIEYDASERFLDVSLSQTLNRRTTGGGAHVEYALSPYTTVTAGADEALDRFRVAHDRDTNTLSTFAGVRFSPRAVISGDAALGYTRVDPRSPTTPTFSGITPKAGLTYKLQDLFSVGVGAQRGIENSFYGDRPYYLFTLYEASARLALFHHFDVGASVQYTELNYQRFLDVASASPPPRDFIRMETVNIGMPLKRQLRVGCFAQRWRRISDDRPYETTRIGLELTVGPATLSPRGIFLTGPGR